jgi:hypothetical protein
VALGGNVAKISRPHSQEANIAALEEKQRHIRLGLAPALLRRISYFNDLWIKVRK